MDRNFGVVCLGCRGIFCTTCRSSTHVSHLKNCIEKCSHRELTPQLKKFVDFEVCETKTPCIKKSPLSGKLISFHLPPHAKECMRNDHTQQFNMHDGIARLIPAAVPICPCCGVTLQKTPLGIHRPPEDTAGYTQTSRGHH